MRKPALLSNLFPALVGWASHAEFTGDARRRSAKTATAASVAPKKSKNADIQSSALGGEDHESHHPYSCFAGARAGHRDRNGCLRADAAVGCLREFELLTDRA